MPREINILNGSFLEPVRLTVVSRRLELTFSAPVNLVCANLDLRVAYDSSRRQTYSTELLTQILDGTSDVECKRIGIVDVDLFIPVLTFVFGEAQLRGTAAIVSTHRLSNQFYGLPRDEDLMIHRLEKEMVHELGHTFGLLHCHQFECVMRASTYVEEIDLKQNHFCDSCRRQMTRPTGER